MTTPQLLVTQWWPVKLFRKSFKLGANSAQIVMTVAKIMLIMAETQDA